MFDEYFQATQAATIAAMAEAEQLNQSDGVDQRGGKKYLEVKHRISVFRRHFGTTMGIETKILDIDEQLVRVQATIRDQASMLVGSGIAEERRGSNNVNKTSALENCETSAIGRALASMGMHGGEYASANELDTAHRNGAAIASVAAVSASPAQATPGTDWAGYLADKTDEIVHFERASQLHGFIQDENEMLQKLRVEQPALADKLVICWTQKSEELSR